MPEAHIEKIGQMVRQVIDDYTMDQKIDEAEACELAVAALDAELVGYRMRLSELGDED